MPARANTAATGAQSSEKGITWNDDMQKELDSTMDTLASYAKSAGKSEGEYLKQLYGVDFIIPENATFATAIGAALHSVKSDG